MAYCYVQSTNGGGVNVRSSKSQDSSRLGTIPEGARIDIVTCDATWATLVYNNVPAFVQHRFIDNPPSTYGSGLGEYARALCNTNDVNVRSAPTLSAPTNGSQLDKGDSVTVTDFASDGTYIWYLIGEDRWVRGDFLAPANGYSGNNDGGVGHIPNNKYEMYGPSTQVLRYGSRGQAVENLQRTLAHAGLITPGEYEENYDGIFGTMTENAVRSYQTTYKSQYNLGSVDGIVGDKTKEALWFEDGFEVAQYCTAVL